jgi:hypothetical protein
MDAIGYLTFAAPAIGEYADVLWAPLSAFIFYRAFGGGRKAVLGAAVNFLEEILPFTDFIPTFTIAWLVLRFSKPQVNMSPATRV